MRFRPQPPENGQLDHRASSDWLELYLKQMRQRNFRMKYSMQPNGRTGTQRTGRSSRRESFMWLTVQEDILIHLRLYEYGRPGRAPSQIFLEDFKGTSIQTAIRATRHCRKTLSLRMLGPCEKKIPRRSGGCPS
jgi:hypothetical protein